MHTVFKISELALWQNTRCPQSLFAIQKISLCFIYCHGRVREPLSFLEKSRKTLLQIELQKYFVIHIKNLPQHLSEKFIGDNLSITDIVLRN